MTTDNQLSPNHTNAPEDNGRSRLNATRNAVTGQVSAMPDDDRAARDKFFRALMDDLAPFGAMETQLAQRIATDSWRLNRLSAIEDNVYALGGLRNAPNLTPGPSSANTSAQNAQISSALAMAVTFTEHSAELQRLSLYEQRLNRAIQQNLETLKKLQAERRSANAAQLEEAKLLLQLTESKGIDYYPPADGFVFSAREIRAAIVRDRRLHEARHAGFSPSKPGPALSKAA